MTTPDYPLMSPGGYEMYQLAQIATFVADRLRRHRGAKRGPKGAPDRAGAVRDLALAATALDAAAGASEPGPNSDLLPRPIDTHTYARARELVTGGQRWADIVSLAPTGGQGWAVVGHVPGIGPVGAQVGTREMAQGLMAHMLTMPAATLESWAVVREPVVVPTLPQQIDLAAAVESLDPERPANCAVAAALRGLNRRSDLAIQKRFRDVDLDTRHVVGAPASADVSAPTARRANPAPVQTAAASAPTISAGP